MMSKPFIFRNVVKESLHQSCLPTTGSTADNPVLSVPDQAHDSIPNMRRHTTRCNQLIGAIPAVEFADGEGRPVDRRWRADNSNTRAVRQACIQNGILRREVLPEDAGDTLYRRLEPVVRVWGCERDMLHNPTAICVDARSAINHQV